MNKETTNLLLNLSGVVVVFGQILLALLVFAYLIFRLNTKNKQLKNLFNFISQNALSFAFFVASSATVGSLFLSEIAKLPPCMLCWYQRIFMFPQGILLGIAVFTNDNGIKKYIIALSAIGILIAIYHYILQVTQALPLPCADDVVSCTVKQIELFGYLTIPLMSATAFALVLFFTFFVKKK